MPSYEVMTMNGIWTHCSFQGLSLFEKFQLFLTIGQNNFEKQNNINQQSTFILYIDTIPILTLNGSKACHTYLLATRQHAKREGVFSKRPEAVVLKLPSPLQLLPYEQEKLSDNIIQGNGRLKK